MIHFFGYTSRVKYASDIHFVNIRTENLYYFKICGQFSVIIYDDLWRRRYRRNRAHRCVLVGRVINEFLVHA